MLKIVFTVAIKATGLQARNFIELHRLSNEGLNAVGLIFLVLTANVLLKHQAFVNERKKSMNKILFAAFVVVLSLGITFYIHQNVDAGTPSVDASASCGDNSASASVSPSISDPLVEDEKYEGNASCSARAGFNSDNPPDIELWAEVVRKHFLWWSWLAVDNNEHSANAILMIDRNGNMPVDTSADASGSLGDDSDDDTCPSSS